MRKSSTREISQNERWKKTFNSDIIIAPQTYNKLRKFKKNLQNIMQLGEKLFSDICGDTSHKVIDHRVAYTILALVIKIFSKWILRVNKKFLHITS